MNITEEELDEVLEEFSPQKKRGHHLIGKVPIRTSPKKNLIKDSLLHPYYIKIEGNKAYSVLKENSQATIGYYTTFGNALKRIALEKVDVVEEDTERTLKQYLTDYLLHLEKFSQSITI